MTDWLYDKVVRVPEISDSQINEMRHIEPVLWTDGMYRRIRGVRRVDPRNVSCIWDPHPYGKPFTFDTLNMTRIVTQHCSSIFFKPSLAEVYAWIRVFMPETWMRVRYFCLGHHERIARSTDVMCQCDLMGGSKLRRGASQKLPNGETAYQLVEID